MFAKGRSLKCVAAVAVILAAQLAQADVFHMPSGYTSLEMVTVGDPGNTADPTTGYGAVGYSYQIGKYEVTNAQYRELLNAKASVGDPYGLYNASMGGAYGGIARSGLGTQVDPWVYSAKDNDPNWDNRPVNYVSFWNAARLCNWLQNGQGSGDTEIGAYLNIGNDYGFARLPSARYFVPNENEWYKAAYYDPNKSGGAGYWTCPTRSNDDPVSQPPPGSDNSANILNFSIPPVGYAVGPPYFSTVVGAYTSSSSAYGTYDQCGNVYEWNEGIYLGFPPYRVLRGSSWSFGLIGAWHAYYRDAASPAYGEKDIGFRVVASVGVNVPEPSSMTLVITGVLCVLAHAWRRWQRATCKGQKTIAPEGKS